MFQPVYEEMVEFASQGELDEELKRAREEYVRRTGDLFETDESYERRIATFLEWYVFDRAVGFNPNKTPAKLFIEDAAGRLTTPELNRLRDLTRTNLSLFEYKRAKNDHLTVVDLLTKTRHQVFERRRPAGLESGDILEARVVPFDDELVFSEVFTCHPRDARKAILRAAKRFRKSGGGDQERVDLVHRVAYLTNRCERYKHVDPRQIFADLKE